MLFCHLTRLELLHDDGEPLSGIAGLTFSFLQNYVIYIYIFVLYCNQVLIVLKYKVSSKSAGLNII